LSGHLPAAGWRRGLTTRHRSRGVIRAGFPALCPRTPNNESRSSAGEPAYTRRCQRHSDHAVVFCSAQARAWFPAAYGFGVGYCSAAFPHCSTMTRPQRSFAHLPDEQFDALLRLMNLYRRQALRAWRQRLTWPARSPYFNISEQYSAFFSNQYQTPVKKRTIGCVCDAKHDATGTLSVVYNRATPFLSTGSGQRIFRVGHHSDAQSFRDAILVCRGRRCAYAYAYFLDC